mmetsp:Transcript_33625/g.70700  ORF Transcript_33625/g.70700 Transcript_33625/m.70700 type:complete len:86 (-) Transcript_33625:276-533(-)
MAHSFSYGIAEVACKIHSVAMASSSSSLSPRSQCWSRKQTKTLLWNENDANDDDDDNERMWIDILNEGRYFTECAAEFSLYESTS